MDGCVSCIRSDSSYIYCQVPRKIHVCDKSMMVFRLSEDEEAAVETEMAAETRRRMKPRISRTEGAEAEVGGVRFYC